MREKIAGYFRISMEDDDRKEESNSVTNQRMLVRRYILEHKDLASYEYVEFYDDGVSGATMRRPGMQQLLEKLKQNEIGCIIVKDLSRFSRDYIVLGTYMEQIFPFFGIRFISVTDHYDSRDYAGKTAEIDIGFKSLLADFYCKDVSEKTRSAVWARKQRGKYATGNTPFGYRKNEENREELLVVPEEAALIRRIFDLSLAGAHLTQICRVLNDEKIRTPSEFKNLRGKQSGEEAHRDRKYWQPGMVRRILTNESYVGNMVYGKSVQAQVGGSGAVLKPREEWSVFQNHHEPIISGEDFARVQEKFFCRGDIERCVLFYALKGRVYCGCCKRRLKGIKLAGDKLVYYCEKRRLSSENDCMSGRFDNQTLERIVLEELKRQIVLRADVGVTDGQMCLHRRRRADGLAVKRRAAEKEIAKLVEQKAAVLEHYHAGGMTREQYMEARSALGRQITEKRSLQECGKNALDASLEGDAEDTEFMNSAGFLELTKEMTDAFLERIEISNRGQIDIYWKFKGEADNPSK